MPELTGQDLVDYIRQERRLELCYEGFRWFDLRRYGMPSFSRDWVVRGKSGNLCYSRKRSFLYTSYTGTSIGKE